jgi:predicted Rossmann fold nucleotide-binding protein DprA/Smf involved in DNA uptake
VKVRTKDDVLAEIGHTAHELEHELSTASVLRDRRNALYVEAQSAGATIAQIAERAGVTPYAIKFSLGQMRRQKTA